MSRQIRHTASIDAAREILKLLGVPGGSEDAGLVCQAAYFVLDAIYRVEGHFTVYGCAFLCPRCYHEYRINISLRGRTVTCVECGHTWRAPEVMERN